MSVVSYTRHHNKQVGVECFSTRRPAADHGKLASDAIIIASNFGPLPIGGGLFVLNKQEE